MPVTNQFEWSRHPLAERLVDETLKKAVLRSPSLADLSHRLHEDTSTRLFDWLDHIVAPVSTSDLQELGFVNGWLTAEGVWRHPNAQLPAVVLAGSGVAGDEYGVALRVDDVVAFAQAQEVNAQATGAPRSALRRVVVRAGDGVSIAAVERRSWSVGVTPALHDSDATVRAVEAWRTLAERPRNLDGPDGVRQQTAAAERAVELVGVDLAAGYFLELERRYWQRRNLAGTMQHARQDRLGLGWGNNDHHTFRSSRAAFRPLVQFLTKLGFQPREHFYAGADAGWGALVLEHPGCGGVIFADVDLASDEVDVDFTITPLDERSDLGTVGLWCALHGESVLAAGMHHLEGQFDFDGLRADLARIGITHMAPFSDFPHLRQAFTQAERWRVDAGRLRLLVAAGHLTPDAADHFATDGAPGSHLENLARRDGYKGFNQHNVSTVIRATDPRRYATVGGNADVTASAPA